MKGKEKEEDETDRWTEKRQMIENDPVKRERRARQNLRRRVRKKEKKKERKGVIVLMCKKEKGFYERTENA